MSIRKILYILSSEQTKVLLSDIERIKQRNNEIAIIERHEQKENQKSRDNRCPKCMAHQDKIVDRIMSVVGKGNINGNLFKTSGFILINTEAVNHCTVCSHEWKKFKTKAVTELATIKVILNYLSDIIRNPKKNAKCSWKHEAIEIFKDCHAEAIYSIQSKHKKSIRYHLSKRQLRKNYKSIFIKK